MRRVLIAVAAAAFVFLSGCDRQKAVYQDAVEIARNQIWQDINSGKCSSATAAIMIEEKIVYAEGFGMADRGKSTPVDDKTLFNIGSISKVHVTAAIMLLVDDGKVLLDEPVTEYLPDFKMADPRYKKITVRMLLNHTSGLPGTEINNSFGFQYNEKMLEETMDVLARSHLKHEPGAIYVYCNDGFTLAEMIVERLSGKKYIDFIEERILVPLGLKNTYLSVGELKGKPVALYYEPKAGKMHPPEVVSLIGAGGLSSTPADLCRFAQGLLTEGKLLSKSSLEEMQKVDPVSFWCELKNQPFSRGLGWDFTALPAYEAEGIQVLGKSGGTFNYTSMVFTVPAKKVSVAVVASGVASNAMKIALDMLDAIMIENEWLPKEEREVSMPPRPQAIPAEFVAQCGYYAAANSMKLIEADTSKNIVTVYALEGEEKNPEILLRYNNGYLHGEDGTKYYFTTCGQETYFVMSLARFKADDIIMQKIPPVDLAQKLKIDMAEKQWLLRNAAAYSGIGGTNEHYVKSFLYEELPGYVYFNGLKVIEGPEFAGMPFNSVRDQSELTLFEKEGQTWAWVSDMLYSPIESAAVIKEGRNSVEIKGDAYSQWLAVNDGAILGFTKPKGGRVIVFSPGKGNFPVYDSAIDSGKVYAEEGSFIEFIGKPKDVFTVEVSK